MLSDADFKDQAFLHAFGTLLPAFTQRAPGIDPRVVNTSVNTEGLFDLAGKLADAATEHRKTFRKVVGIE